MDGWIERCCGLDVHKQTVAACARVPGAQGRRTQEVRTFGTTTPDLLALQDWLAAHQVTQNCRGLDRVDVAVDDLGAGAAVRAREGAVLDELALVLERDLLECEQDPRRVRTVLRGADRDHQWAHPAMPGHL